MNGIRSCIATLAVVSWCVCGFPSLGYTRDDTPVIVMLGQGLSIEIPRAWAVIAGNQKKELDSAVQRMLDLSGIMAQTGTLIAAESPVTSPYAYVEVRVHVEQTYAQAQAASLSGPDLAAYDFAVRDVLSRVFTSAGISILEWYGSTKGSTNGYHYLLTKYRRTSPFGQSPRDGPVKAQVMVFPFGSKSVSVTGSYTDLGQPPMWKTTVERACSSFKIQAR